MRESLEIFFTINHVNRPILAIFEEMLPTILKIGTKRGEGPDPLDPPLDPPLVTQRIGHK